ncbi:hypothetical protein [Actinoplanes sp. NPDC048796]|uniref:hypothetical protein n=1 Tax=Actinoplanes sp. NPDC048796 TaxID=3155640 RepID=UPI0033E270A5
MKDLFDRETGSSAMGCWPALGHDVTDVGITLRQGSTGQRRDALREALRADPLVREPVFESRNPVLAVHREVHRASGAPYLDHRRDQPTNVVQRRPEKGLDARPGRPRDRVAGAGRPFRWNRALNR